MATYLANGTWRNTVKECMNTVCKYLGVGGGGDACRKFLKEPLRGTKMLSSGCGMNFFFTPKRYQIMGFNFTKLKIS